MAVLEKVDLNLQPLPLKDKVAIVTGGARGIGAAITEQLAALGAKVVINYNSSFKEAEKMVNKMKNEGGQVCCLPGNVADKEHMNRVAELTKQRFDKIDILINNAGITADKLMLEMESDEWRKVIETNLNGVFHTTHAVLPAMKEQGEGCIVNMSSIIGQTGNLGQANYAAAKAGVIGFTKTLAQEMARYNIRANAICPGFIDTPMTEKIPDKAKEKIIKKIPMGRLGDKKEIAKTAAFLILHGTYITGQTINVNGGMYME